MKISGYGRSVCGHGTRLQMKGNFMKNSIRLTAVFLAALLLTGCRIRIIPRPSGAETTAEAETAAETETGDETTAGEETTSAETLPPAAPVSAENFLPHLPDTLYEYRGEGNEFASYTMTTDYISGNMQQQRINNGGTEIVRVFRAGDGKITELMSKGEIYYRENYLGSAFDPAEEKILLMEPIETGTSWTLADGSVKTITNTAYVLFTPSGTHEAVEVTTSDSGGAVTNLDYYAYLGLVKTIYNPGPDQVSSTLSAIRTNAPLERQISFFYPNADDDILYYTDKTIRFPTNSDTAAVLEAAYKDSAPVKILTDNTKINSLGIDADNIVRLDLSKDFVTEMSAGAMYESLILQCLANTFCRYYNAEKLALTIDGGAYESGHILFEAGDLLTADYGNSLPAE